MYISCDTETRRIGKGQITPPIICASFATVEEGQPSAWILEKANPEFKSSIIDLFSEPAVHWIMHNAAFDLGVLTEAFPELMPIIWKALREGRIHDTMIREMLYNLTATGDIDTLESNGVVQRASYSLASLTKKYSGIDRSTSKEGEDSVRINYEMVEDLLQSEWPPEFITYSEDDASDTLTVFVCQERARKSLQERMGYDAFKTEAFRVMTHFSLQLMTKRGNMLDREKVLEVTKEFQDLYNDQSIVKPLVLSSFISEYIKLNKMLRTEESVQDAIVAFDGLDSKTQQKWTGTGIIIPAKPAEPYANNAKEHLITCPGHTDHPDHSAKAVKDCSCPFKMRGEQAERGSDTALHNYIWDAGMTNDQIDIKLSDATLKALKETGEFEDATLEGCLVNKEYSKRFTIRPKEVKLSVDKAWLAQFAHMDPILERLATRRRYQKIITSYLPGLYWNNDYSNCPDTLEGHVDRLGGKEPADIVHSCFRPLKKTGRVSSYANTYGKGKNKKYMFPSMNGQQVDPRIRPCIIPRPGFKLFSIDYSGMELGTLAQKCVNLFGYSVMGDVINSGRDVHAYMGMYIARELDTVFGGLVDGLEPDELYEIFYGLKEDMSDCPSVDFLQTWKDTGHDKSPTWADFYAHYRKFAKPTDLGYPGGLGPRTFINYAKGTYGVTVNLEIATRLRDIWKQAFPEMAMYLDYVSKQCFDPVHAPETVEDEEGNLSKRKYYAYDTPFGMHRAKADFCSCANGMGLQAFSAEGALTALNEIMYQIHGDTGSILAATDKDGAVWPTIFIHDEIFGEIRDDLLTTQRIEEMQRIMKVSMESITPDIVAGTEACLMNRWSKKAFHHEVDGELRPYEEFFEDDSDE